MRSAPSRGDQRSGSSPTAVEGRIAGAAAAPPQGPRDGRTPPPDSPARNGDEQRPSTGEIVRSGNARELAAVRAGAMDWLWSIVASLDCGAPPLSQDRAQLGCSWGANQAFALRPSLKSPPRPANRLPDGGRRSTTRTDHWSGRSSRSSRRRATASAELAFSDHPASRSNPSRDSIVRFDPPDSAAAHGAATGGGGGYRPSSLPGG
jgi:hypothetical protein